MRRGTKLSKMILGMNMKKSKPYALIVLFLLSFGVVIGGWFLTEALLLQKQEEFLARTGRIAWQTGMPSALQPAQPGECYCLETGFLCIALAVLELTL